MQDEIEYLKKLHYEVFHMLDKKEYGKLNKKMRFMQDCGLVYYEMPIFKIKDNNVPNKYKNTL